MYALIIKVTLTLHPSTKTPAEKSQQKNVKYQNGSHPTRVARSRPLARREHLRNSFIAHTEKRMRMNSPSIQSRVRTETGILLNRRRRLRTTDGFVLCVLTTDQQASSTEARAEPSSTTTTTEKKKSNQPTNIHPRSDPSKSRQRRKTFFSGFE